MNFTTQVANDVSNDSLLLEVLNEAGDCVAVVERFDTDKVLKFQLFADSMDVACVEEILSIAQKELHAFEDGTPLNEAKRDSRLTIDSNGN